MLQHVFLSLLMSLFMLAVVWLCQWHRIHHVPAHGKRGGRSLLLRRLKPRTPLDCPTCCLATSRSSSGTREPVPVRPWREVKSRRGAPKRVETEGFACPNQACQYYGISDADVHAIVSDGSYGKAERIQRFRCQACGHPFSARIHTPMYRLKTPSQRVALVLSALAEGLDLSAAERVFGIRHCTIMSWLLRAGAHAQCLHERSFHMLTLPHLQLDELRTRLRSHTQILWLWVAIDPLTKCIPVLLLGPRTHRMAHLLIHRLREQLAPGCVPLFTSDGLNAYFYALTALFGSWIKESGSKRKVRQWQVAAGLMYGQVQKRYRRRRLERVKHVIRLGTSPAFTEALQALGFSGRVNTAFIERVNLTIRHGVSALARRTWATAVQTPHLQAHLYWWQAYYHGCRALIPRCAWPWFRHEREMAGRRSRGIESGRQPWQLGEPVADGPQGRCSVARCCRSLLESR